MTYIILALSMAANLFDGILKKYAGGRFENKQAMHYGFNAVAFATCTAALLIIGGIPEISLFTLLLGIAFGVAMALQSVCILKAYERGPFSLTVVIVSLSTIIPTLSGCIFWNEAISPVQIGGIVLMLVCFLSSVDFKEDKRSTGGTWFVCVAVAFVGVGLIGVMQKIHQTSDFKDELDGFLIIAFAISFVYSFCSYLVIRKKQNESGYNASGNDFNLLMIIMMITSGICVAINNKANLYLSGVMDSAVFFPIVNGGGLVLSTLVALIIFREKLSAQKWIGVIVGIVAVIMLCI